MVRMCILPLLAGRQERLPEMGVGLSSQRRAWEVSALRGVGSSAPQWTDYEAPDSQAWL